MLKFYNSFKSKNYCFFVNNSLGEFDFILPMILSIKKKFSSSKFSIFIVSNKIAIQFNTNSMYRKLSTKLGVKIFSNPKNFNFKKDNISNTSHLIEILSLIFNCFRIIEYYLSNDVIFIENSGRALGTKFLRIINFFKKKRIILIPHTSSKIKLKSKVRYYEKPLVFKKAPYLITDKSEKNFYNKNYSGDAILIKNPINKEWKSFIKQNFKKKNKVNFICIYLNNLIDRRTYIYLLLLTLKKIFSYKKNTLIYIKRHPRNYKYSEESVLLGKIINKFKKKLKIKITNENSSILSMFSMLNISLMSNSIFLSNVLNKNSVYFFINSKEVKKRYKTLPLPLYEKKIKSKIGSKKIAYFFKNFFQ